MKGMLIHIGYHKACSTWLQTNLFSQPGRGFLPLCPASSSLSEGRRASFLAPYFIFSEDGSLLSPFENRTAEVLEQYRQIEPGSSTLVPTISAERLSGNPHASGFDARVICDRLSDAFPEARILIIVREQVAAVLSNYFQYLRRGGHRSLLHYLTTKYDGRRPGFSFGHFKYDLMIDYYQRTFSKENVLVLPMEMLVKAPVPFVESIGNFVGTKIPSDLPFAQRENPGSPRYVEIKTRLLNLFRYSDSVNGYAVPVQHPDRAWIKALRRGLARCVSEDREKACVAELLSVCRSVCGDRFVESNRRTSQLIGRDLRQDFGYM